MDVRGEEFEDMDNETATLSQRWSFSNIKFHFKFYVVEAGIVVPIASNVTLQSLRELTIAVYVGVAL
jgi:hypothetical protein